MREIKLLLWMRQGLLDLYALFGFLTRLPCPWPHQQGTPIPFPPFNRVLVYGPLVGALLSLYLILIIYLLSLANLPPALIAALGLVCFTLITGGLHEDGLADCCDGFWGSSDKEKRLEIMSDSRLGSYGALGLFFTSLCRWICLSHLIQAVSFPTLVWSLVLVYSLSRSFFLPLACLLPPAKSSGLGHMSRRGKHNIVRLIANGGICLCLFALLYCLFPQYWLSLTGCYILAMVVTLLWAALCHHKIGGQSGDCLGANVILIEIACFAFLLSRMTEGAVH